MLVTPYSYKLISLNFYDTTQFLDFSPVFWLVLAYILNSTFFTWIIVYSSCIVSCTINGSLSNLFVVHIKREGERVVGGISLLPDIIPLLFHRQFKFNVSKTERMLILLSFYPFIHWTLTPTYCLKPVFSHTRCDS